MDVTDILRDRMHEPAGLQRMVVVSLVFHAALATFVILSPARFLGRRAEEPKNVMTITIGGGGEGQRTQGLTSIGGRPVQVATPEEPPKREAVRAPAAKEPEMTLPAKNARPTKAQPAPKIEQAPEGAKGRTPTKGSKVEFGTSVAVTGAKGQGFGLASGGGPGSGSSLDVSDFCCPDYIVVMMERVRNAWSANQGARGEVYIHFNINRNGSISAARVDASSGNTLLDNAALRAVLATRSLPPLPDQYSNPSLGVRLQFIYQ